MSRVANDEESEKLIFQSNGTRFCAEDCVTDSSNRKIIELNKKRVFISVNYIIWSNVFRIVNTN